MTKVRKTMNLPIPDIIRLYSIDHIPFYLIAKRYRVGSATIRKLLCDNNIVINRSLLRTTIVDATELYRLYAIEHKTSTEIANHFGLTFTTILRKLREANIPIRDSHYNEFHKSRIRISELPSFIRASKVVNSRLTGNVTCPTCGKTRELKLDRLRIIAITNNQGKCNNCTRKTKRAISKLDTANIIHLYNQAQLSTKDIAHKHSVSIKTIYKVLQLNKVPIRIKSDTRAILYQNAIHNKGTLDKPAIGDMCRGYDISLNDKSYYVRVACSRCNQERWQVKNHIAKSPLCKACSMYLSGLKHSGENAQTWLGGISFLPYTKDFNDRLKEAIRERDNYTCQLCGIPQNGKQLAVHHIDYDKTKTTQYNLISLCPTSCHSKTNHNREYWTNYFTELLHKRGILNPTS